MKRKYRSVITKRINESLKKIAVILLFLIISSGYLNIPGTNSFFSDSFALPDNIFNSGLWIPTLSMTVDPEIPDGEDGRYLNAPCIKLFSDLDDVSISYTFTNIDTIHGSVSEDTCIFPPEGDSIFSAIATNNANPLWASEALERVFRVGESNAPSGAVVINEIMWMGSTEHTQDEWIELRNMSPLDIDISDWIIENAAVGNKDVLIPAGSIIPANGYFLIASTDDEKKTAIKATPDLIDKKLHLKDFKNSDLILKDHENKTIDTAKGSTFWPAGWHGFFLHLSMSRHEIPNDGSSASDWYTSIDPEANSTDYWKSEGLNFGTPGAMNLAPNCQFTDETEAPLENDVFEGFDEFGDVIRFEISNNLNQANDESSDASNDIYPLMPETDLQTPDINSYDDIVEEDLGAEESADLPASEPKEDNTRKDVKEDNNLDDIVLDEQAKNEDKDKQEETETAPPLPLDVPTEDDENTNSAPVEKPLEVEEAEEVVPEKDENEDVNNDPGDTH